MVKIDNSLCSIPSCANFIFEDDLICIYCKESVCKDHFTVLGLCSQCFEKFKEYTLEEVMAAIDDDDY